MPTLNSDTVRIEDPEFYIDEPRDVYAQLQADSTIFRYEPLDTFVLARHDDIRHVARHPEIFSSANGLFLNELRLTEEDREVFDTLFDPSGEQFAFADPPRHRDLRRVASGSFTPRALEHMAEGIGRCAHSLVSAIGPDQPVEFVDAVAAPLPIKVAELLIGLPTGQDDRIRDWSDALESMNQAQSRDDILAAIQRFSTMNDFFREQFALKREQPGDDLISTLLAAELDGAALSEVNLLIYCTTFLAAGSDTTRSLLAGMALALAEHPNQLDRLVSDPNLIDNAIEEALRWTTPARGFLRTVTKDTEIRGTTMRPGQRVYLLFAAGNRDPEVFPDPWSFDVARPEAGLHLSFGFGAHVCIAAQLARLEARILYRLLLNRFSRIDLTEKPRRIRQILRDGWIELPLAFS